MAEYTLYGFGESGNAYKAALMLNLCKLDWQLRFVDFFKGETRTPEYRKINEMGERVEITRNGTRIAVIEPAQPNPLGGLIESGELRPAQGRLPLVVPSTMLAPDSAGVDAVLADRYDTGRW